MRNITLPYVDSNAHYVACANNTNDLALKARLVASAPDLNSDAHDYLIACQHKTWFSLPSPGSKLSASNEEIADLYSRVMARQGRAGRAVYEKILMATRQCPLCGQNLVSTLDHYLPKSHYSHYAILPANLVPSCRDCNFEKKEFRPTSGEEQTFHPYYDNVEYVRWLFAELVLQDGASLRFFVIPPDFWSVTLKARAFRHFEVFKLAKYFATYAANELATLPARLSKILAAGGVDAVKADLLLEAEGAARAHTNSWKTAMYEALAAHDVFCEGGFSKIGC